MTEPSTEVSWAAVRPPAPGDEAVQAPTVESRWFGSSALAFLSTLVLLSAFTRIGLFEPPDLSDAVRREIRTLTPLLLVAVALVHASVAALAARARRVPVALAVLFASTAALPLLAEALRAPIHGLLAAAAPAYCDYSPHSCPPGAWSPLVGALVGALLAPVVVAAVRLRGQRAHDTTPRMLFVTGLWTGVVTSALRVAHLAGSEPLALAWTVTAVCTGVGLADTALRWLRLSTLLRLGRITVGPPRDGDPAGLRPYASLPSTVPFDAVLRLDEGREDSPYRVVRHGRALACSPRDAAVLVRGLAGRCVRQFACFVAVLAALAAATVGSAGPADGPGETVHVITSP